MMCFYDYGCRFFQGVDILNQGVTVIVGFRLGEGVIRDNAFVNIIEGTVQHCCQLFGTGNREHCAGSGCAGQYYAGAAAGAPPEQCDGASRPERGRNEIATGEGIAGDQTVQVIIPAGNSIFGSAVTLPVQVDISVVACDRFGTRQRIPKCEEGFPVKPTEDKHRRVRGTTSVQGQIKDNVFDRAVFLLDLLIGIRDQLEGVFVGIRLPSVNR